MERTWGEGATAGLGAACTGVPTMRGGGLVMGGRAIDEGVIGEGAARPAIGVTAAGFATIPSLVLRLSTSNFSSK